MSISLQTQTRMAELFVSLFEGERQAEIMRQVLVEQREFNAMALFSTISRGKETITHRDLDGFLQYHRIHATQSEVEQIFTFHSSGSDELTYNKFLNIILPSCSQSLKNVKQPHKVQKQITRDIEIAFSKVLTQEIYITRQLGCLRQELCNRPDFDDMKAYDLLESFGPKNSRKIDHYALKRFFSSLSFNVTEDDILYLLRRADRDKDGRIGQSDFSKLLMVQGQRRTQRKSVNASNTTNKKRTPSITKLNARSSQPSPMQTKQSTSRRSNDHLFCKLNSLASHSPISTLQRTSRVTPEITKRTVSSFEPTLSSIRKTEQSLSINQIPAFQKSLATLLNSSTQTNVNQTAPNTQRQPLEEFNPNTQREITPRYKHYGVDSRVIDEDIKQLVSLLVRYLDNYHQLCETKNQIMDDPSFCIDNFYQELKQGNPYITIQSFENTVNDLYRFNYSIQDIKYFFQVADLDRDGNLKEQDFHSIFEPYQQSSTKNGQITEFQIQQLKNLFDAMILMQKQYQEDKQIFFHSKRYSLLSLFEYLDQKRTNTLTDQDLFNLFQSFDLPLSDHELRQILQKFTKSRTSRQIDLRLFLNELTPNN